MITQWHGLRRGEFRFIAVAVLVVVANAFIRLGWRAKVFDGFRTPRRLVDAAALASKLSPELIITRVITLTHRRLDFCEGVLEMLHGNERG